MNATLTSTGDGLELTGDLTLATAPKLFAETPRFDTGAAARIDLRGVGEVDSAGLALLLHWRATATTAGAQLTFAAAPPQLREMATITATAKLLGLDRNAA